MKIIVEAALKNIHKLVTHGKDINESFSYVCNELLLTEDEKKDVESLLKDEKKPSKDNPYPNSIYFTVPDEIDDATGVLMYQNVPWDSKGSNDEKNYIQFSDDETLAKAMKALGRKYDFVDNDVKVIGSISFDNISDYKKVLDFMLKNGMLVNFTDSSELDDIEDVSEDTDETQNSGKSVVAKQKSKIEKTDPVKFKTFRSSVVRQRIK